MSLVQQHCVTFNDAPQSGADASPRALSQAGIAQLLAQCPGWQLVSSGSVEQISKSFTTADFRAALQLAQAIGEIAEQENHHPELRLAWGSLTVSWWTHRVSGLHKNDFIMAAKTDRLAQQQSLT